MVSTKYNLKEVRQNEGLSAAKLAALSGVSEKALRDIENGKRPGSAVTWGKIVIGLNKNPEKTRTWKLGDFSQARDEFTYPSPQGRTTSPSSFQVKEPAMTDEVIEKETAPFASSFWESKSFDALAKEQGVQPIDDVSKLSGGWPEDEDIEQFLESIRSIRED